MGCKSPKQGGMKGGFGPAKGGMKGSFASPYGKSCGKGKGGMPPMVHGGDWMCGACGFANRAHNQVCGGGGPMGCKAPQQMQQMQQMHQMPQRTFVPAPRGGGGMWSCLSCGFTNKPHNEVCGGNGPMGCKAPQHGGGHGGGGFKGGGGFHMPVKGGGTRVVDSGVMALVQAIKGAKGGGKDKGGKGKDAGAWICECGFTNKSMNEICGGKGPMGCNAEKPGDWVCECGFINKPANTQCGGRGKMGCNAPKPETGGLQ